jgi:endonuclease-3
MKRRESARSRKQRASRIASTLLDLYPGARCALDHSTPFELLVATVLSAQCTDARVNLVTPELFARYPTPAALAAARRPELEAIIRSTGFFRSKAEHLVGLGEKLVADHGGEVPASMDSLVELPGVGRKTANVVLGNCFGVPAIAVDTHVRRVSGRLGLTASRDPARIERDLMSLVPAELWTAVSHGLILHGRQVCAARKPRCGRCRIEPDCPWPSKTAGEPAIDGVRRS